jgi:hypothetical protein
VAVGGRPGKGECRRAASIVSLPSNRDAVQEPLPPVPKMPNARQQPCPSSHPQIAEKPQPNRRSAFFHASSLPIVSLASSPVDQIPSSRPACEGAFQTTASQNLHYQPPASPRYMQRYMQSPATFRDSPPPLVSSPLTPIGVPGEWIARVHPGSRMSSWQG